MSNQGHLEVGIELFVLLPGKRDGVTEGPRESVSPEGSAKQGRQPW